MSAVVGEVLTTIAACTGAGAFIDFYIGKNGQKRVKDWLETWWYRLSDIPVKAVGREEALNALRVVDYLFGPMLFSWKRLRSAVKFKIISLCVYPGIFLIDSLYHGTPIQQYKSVVAYFVFLDIFLIYISISFSRLTITLTIHFMRANQLENVFLIIYSIFMQVLVLMYLSSNLVGLIIVVAANVGFSAAHGIVYPAKIGLYVHELAVATSSIWDALRSRWGPDPLYTRLMSNTFAVDLIFKGDGAALLRSLWAFDSIKLSALIMNLGRILVALIFFGSYLWFLFGLGY
jgi:hypothetical protein